MGGLGYVLADTVTYGPDEVIFEAGSGPESTPYLRRCGPLHTADVTAGVEAVDLLTRWPADGMRIKFGYLDSYDWPYWNMSRSALSAQRQAYAERGVELTADASAAHHLALAELLHPLVAPGAVVVIDDTWAANPGFDGKGRDAVPYLLDAGWHVCAQHVDAWSGPAWSERNRFYVAVRYRGERP